MKFTDLNDAITSLPIGRSILIKSNGGREWFGRVIECPRIVNYWGGLFYRRQRRHAIQDYPGQDRGS